MGTSGGAFGISGQWVGRDRCVDLSDSAKTLIRLLNKQPDHDV